MWNCEKEEVFEIPLKKNKIETVSITAAKELFADFNRKKLLSKSLKESFKFEPLWETINQEELSFTEAQLTSVDIKPSKKLSYSPKLFFIKINGHNIKAFETTIAEEVYSSGKLKKGIVYYHSIEGDFMTGYRVINGKTISRIKKKKNINQAGFLFLFYQSCEGDMNIEDLEGNCFDEVKLYIGESMESFMSGYNSSGNFYPVDAGDSTASDGVSDNDSEGGSSSNSNTDDDQITYTKNPCVNAIIKSLQEKDLSNSTIPDLNGMSHLSQMVLDLFDHSKKYNLTFDIKQLNDLGSGVNGDTSGFNISLDTDLVKDATQLFIAKTIIHESLHAFIHYTVRDNPGSTMTSSISRYYQLYGKDSNLTEHQFMGQYVDALAHSLSSYDNHRQDISYYTALSWAGLESSNAYKALTNKTDIQKIIENERFAKRDAKSTKCP